MLSYGALNRRANQLARHLCARGLRPQEPVALCMEASTAFLIGALAALKAGGVHVPLDPTYPEQRLRLMLNASGAFLLLTDGSDSVWPEAERIDLSDESVFSSYRSDNLALEGSSQWAAYIIFTSGSTGVPKGVVVPHCGGHRLVLETNYTSWLFRLRRASFDYFIRRCNLRDLGCATQRGSTRRYRQRDSPVALAAC